MARGLSELQIKILAIVRDMGTGYLTHINQQIKVKLYPDIWGAYANSNEIYLKQRYTWKQGKGYGSHINGKWTADFDGHIAYQNQLLKIRVTISNSITALVRRGLLIKKATPVSEHSNFYGKEYRFTTLSITEEGKRYLNEGNVNL